VSFEMSIPMVSSMCLFLTLSCHAGPKPKYPFRFQKKTEVTLLSDGPHRPRGERSNLRRCLAEMTCCAAVPASHRNCQNHKTRGDILCASCDPQKPRLGVRSCQTGRGSEPRDQTCLGRDNEVHGIRKVWHQMQREKFTIARCTVARLMKRQSIHGVIRGKVKKATRLIYTLHTARSNRY
jgi:hypothetical protein